MPRPSSRSARSLAPVMPRVQANQPLVASVLDRLLNGDSDVGRGESRASFPTLDEIKESVRRDLEMLLNTKPTLVASEDLGATANSVLTYGLPDFTSLSRRSVVDQDRLRRAIEGAIRRFEPRL